MMIHNNCTIDTIHLPALKPIIVILIVKCYTNFNENVIKNANVAWPNHGCG